MLRAASQFINWLLATSIFTAGCALVLCMATEKLLLGRLPPFYSALHLLVAGCTVLEYNLHHLFNQSLSSGKHEWSVEGKSWHWILVIVSVLACLATLPFISMEVIGCCAVLGLMSFAYSTPLLPFRYKKRLKDYGLIKITVLTSVWVLVTTVLPVVYWKGDFSALWLELILRFLFIFALCLAFDIRDMETDSRNDIDTLPNTIGIKATYRLIDITLALFVMEGILQYLRRHEIRHLVIILITALAARGAISYSRKNAHNNVYLGLVDGVMLLYGLLIIL